MPSQQELKKLEAGLLEDVARVRSQSKQTASSLGVGQRSSKIAGAKAVRFKGRALGRAQLQKSKTAVDGTIKELVQRSGLTNMRQKGMFEADSKKKLTDARLDVVRNAIKWRTEIAKRKMTAAQRKSIMVALGNTVADATEIGVGLLLPTGGSTLGQQGTPTRAAGDLASNVEDFSFEPTRALADLPTPFGGEESSQHAGLGQAARDFFTDLLGDK